MRGKARRHVPPLKPPSARTAAPFGTTIIRNRAAAFKGAFRPLQEKCRPSLSFRQSFRGVWKREDLCGTHYIEILVYLSAHSVFSRFILKRINHDHYFLVLALT